MRQLRPKLSGLPKGTGLLRESTFKSERLTDIMAFRIRAPRAETIKTLLTAQYTAFSINNFRFILVVDTATLQLQLRKDFIVKNPLISCVSN